MEGLDKNAVKILAWECINSFKSTFQKDICNPRKEEFEVMKEDLKDFRKCMTGKLNRLYVISLIAALALIGNLIVKAFG